MSENRLSHWFNFVDLFKAQLPLLISQEVAARYLSIASNHQPLPFVHRDSRKVFVVHGRNLVIRDSMFKFLSALNLEPMEWSSVVQATGKGSPTISEIIDVGFSLAQAIVVLLTGDDEVRLRSELCDRQDRQSEAVRSMQPRANVLYEAGLALGRVPDRVILVKVGEVKLFSDIGGVHLLELDDSVKTRNDLASRLKTAGCAVDQSGDQWQTFGDFG